MSRDLHGDTLTEIVKPEIRVSLFARLNFDSQTLRLWNGAWNKTLDIDGEGPETWVGLGRFGGVEIASEGSDLGAEPCRLMLTGIESTLLSLAVSEPYQNRRVAVWLALIDSTGGIAGEAVQIFGGFMDSMSVYDGGERGEITLECLSELAELERPFERRWTDQDQRIDFPNDRGFEYVSALQRVPIRWGGTAS